jgi:hypothetical protein
VKPTPLDDDRLRAQEAELRELQHSIAHPRIRFGRDNHGRLIAATPTGIFPQGGMVKKIIRRDARGYITEILHVPVTDLAEQIAEGTSDNIRSLSGDVATVTLSPQMFEHLPRSADIEAIRLRAEQLTSKLTGKRVAVCISTPLDVAAEALYSHTHATLTTLAADAEATITVAAHTLPRDLAPEKITRAFAALIGARHPAAVNRIHIVLKASSTTAPANAPATPPAKPRTTLGFRPDDAHRVGDWSNAERVDGGEK